MLNFLRLFSISGWLNVGCGPCRYGGRGAYAEPPKRARVRTRTHEGWPRAFANLRQASRAFHGLLQLITIAVLQSEHDRHCHITDRETEPPRPAQGHPVERVRMQAPAWGPLALKPLLVTSTLPCFPGCCGHPEGGSCDVARVILIPFILGW